MKKLLVVMAVVAVTCLLAAPAFSADKLIVINSATSQPGFKVTDSAQMQVGDQISDARSPRAFNVIANSGGLRLWRVHDSFGAFIELIDSTVATPDTMTSYWDMYAGTQYGPRMLSIRDRTGGLNANRITIGPNGFVGINTDVSGSAQQPNNPLVVGVLNSGSGGNGAYLTAGGVWTDTSSRKSKDNIQALSTEKAFETMKNLAPVTYAYKIDPAEKHVGFIAEDVPELVATKDREHLSPMDIVAVLTKVVQEQNKTIEALSGKIDMLQAQVTRLKSKDMFGSIDPSLIPGN